MNGLRWEFLSLFINKVKAVESAMKPPYTNQYRPLLLSLMLLCIGEALPDTMQVQSKIGKDILTR
jgi:hypothetical protein